METDLMNDMSCNMLGSLLQGLKGFKKVVTMNNSIAKIFILYLMLSRAIVFEKTFSNYASREIGLRHHFENSFVKVEIIAGELVSSD
ncbi:hypothetical protein H5410_026738 [Solanum commersonii]|uniref:Uncharacterized protein n=1 Tax=Solanum commersonii TaxID=4109 RepID=A0A9J5Z2D7_SOLCO|nr:hypothetical protein H5410_026738 [Solanum commersonii]